jgi:hydroxyacylglutathione hydrolase
MWFDGVLRTISLRIPWCQSEQIFTQGEPTAVLEAIAELQLTVTQIWCTHKHRDHVGGCMDLKAAFPQVSIIGSKYEPIPGINKPVGEGDEFVFGGLHVSVMFTPCHTSGHISFLVKPAADVIVDGDQADSSSKMSKEAAGAILKSDNATEVLLQGSPMLFSGDTLFVGGVGRFLEGTAAQMLTNLDRIGKFHPDTVIYCAHEYTELNFKFLAFIDPKICKGRFEEIKTIRKAGIPTVPTTVREEMRFNVFMKCNQKRIQDMVGCPNSPVSVMAKLRRLKNKFNYDDTKAAASMAARLAQTAPAEGEAAATDMKAPEGLTAAQISAAQNS